MQLPTTFAGVDVSKSSLDAAVAGGNAHTLLANTSAAIDTWLAKLPAATSIAVESTGPYHQLLVQRCQCAGRAVYVLNAKDVYFYAKGLGSRAKTDRLDAQVIARYLAEHHRKLHPCVSSSQTLGEVEKLLRQRAALVSKRVALRQAFQVALSSRPCSRSSRASRRRSRSWTNASSSSWVQTQACGMARRCFAASPASASRSVRCWRYFSAG